MAYDVSVRSELNQRGISNEDIGYDPNTGYVTIKGQNFMRPQKNYEGTTYTDRGTFENAWNQYNQNQKINQMQNQLLNYQTPANPYTSQFNDLFKQVQNQISSYQQNPYTAQVNSLVQQLMQRANTPFDQNSVYSSPQYAAAQQQVAKQAQQGIRAAQEALGSAGFGRSTTLSDEAQRVQNEANNYLNTQLAATIANQLMQQRQQEFSNLASLLNPLMSQQQFEAAQRQNMINNLASLLNPLMNQQQFAAGQAQQERNNILNALNYFNNLQQQAAENEYRQQALREQQRQANIENALRLGEQYGTYVYPTESGQALFEQVQGLTPLNAQQQQFNQNVQMAQLTGFLPDGTPTNAYQQQQLENLWKVADATGVIPDELAQLYGIPKGTPTLQAKQIAISQQNANTSAYNAETSRMNAERAAKQAQLKAEQPGKNDVISTYVANLEQMTPENRQQFFAKEKANIVQDLGVTGYNQLYSMYFDQYGNPK